MRENLDYEKPELSIIVVTICGSTYLARCLDALTQQVDAPKFEIIVVYDERLADVPSLSNKFINMQMYVKYGSKTPEELASVGIRKAQADVIALTEDHCIPEENWCRAILDAHTDSPAAIGGIVECTATNPLNWAFSFCDYYRYLRDDFEGWTRYLTVCNVSYKRHVLTKIAKVWNDNFHEVSVHNALQIMGEKLLLTSKLAVFQERNVRFWPAVRERFSLGRLFGSRRALDSSPEIRVLYAIFAPVIPFLLFKRMLESVLFRRIYLGIFVRALPILAVLTLAWSIGEFFGNIIGRLPKNVFISRPRNVRTGIKGGKGKTM